MRTNQARNTTTPLHIRLLGDFQLTLGERLITSIDVPRLQSLLAYLVLYQEAPQSRSHIAYLLWPDTTDAQALSNLRTLVHRLRLALPNADRYLHVGRQRIQWQTSTTEASWTLDVMEFEQALKDTEQAEKMQDIERARQALEAAVNLYQGDLLPSCYDEWILPERDRLRQAFLHALDKLATLLESKKAYEAATMIVQRQLRCDPLLESAYRRLMRLYIAEGDRAAALRAYHTCSSVLERELGIAPSRATRDAYEHLMSLDETSNKDLTQQQVKAFGTSLVGRTSEWTQMLSLWHMVYTNGAHLLLLSGDPGIGKTRLAEELQAWVNRQNISTAAACCYALESQLAYAPVATWLRSDALKASLPKLESIWLTELARIVPEVLTAKPGVPQPVSPVDNWQRQRMFEALNRAILAVNQPILLLLDDMQWCDSETLEWLNFLFRSNSKALFLLIGTIRPDEIPGEHPLKPLLVTLQRNRQITEIPLSALGVIETTALASQMAGHQLEPETASFIYQETEGNPLFIVETIRASFFKQSEDSKKSQQNGSLLPSTIKTTIISRFEHLSPPAKEVARIASVIGRAFNFRVLAHASKEDNEALVHALDELWQRGIIREQGIEEYDFSHHQLREVVYATLSATRRRFLHQQVANALEQIYANELDRVSVQIATHYEQAGLTEQAIAAYQRAGEAAMQVFANAEAITAFQKALALLEIAPIEASQYLWKQEIQARLDEPLGDLLALTGQQEAARTAYQQALTLIHDRIAQARLLCKVGNTWETQRKNEAALQYYSMAEHSLGQTPTEHSPEWWQLWIEIRRNRLQVYYWLAQTNKMTELIEQIQPVIEQYASPVQRAAFFQSLYLMSIRNMRYVLSEEALTYSQEAMAAIQEGGSSIEIAWAHLDLGGAYLLRDQFDEAINHLKVSLEVGERTGHLMLQGMSLTFLSIVWRKRGQLASVHEMLEQLEIVANKTENAEFLGMVNANRSWLAWRTGKLAEAKIYADNALELWRQTTVVYPFQWTALWPLIGVALKKNLLDEAIQHAHALLAPPQQCLPDAVTKILNAAIKAWDADQKDTARTQLKLITKQAEILGYL